MKITYVHKQFIVIDDVFSEQHHQLIYNHFINETRFEYIHSKRRIKAFNYTDGNPMWGDPILSRKVDDMGLFPVYPTQTPYDLVIECVESMISQYAHVIGERGHDWDHFFARPYIYPLECGLRWHVDGKYKSSGAFVYYAHKKWHPEWGGELLISSVEKQHADSECGSLNALLADGIGQYIHPKPNRLILMKGLHYHTIKKVDKAAGDNIRMTVQGFFQKQQTLNN